MINVSAMKTECEFYWIIISVIIYGLKILGLAPFSFRMTKKSGKNSLNSNSSSSKVFLPSSIGLAYNILLLVFIPVFTGLFSPQLLSLKNQFESSVSQATDIFQGVSCIFTIFVIIISWTFNQRKATAILNKILEIDAKLPDLDKQPFNKIGFISFATHVIINGSLWAIVWAMESVEPVISDAFVNFFFFNLPSFIIYWFIVEYFMVVGIVARKIYMVNKNLSNFTKLNNYASPPSFLNDYLNGWCLSTHSQLDALNLLRNTRTALFDISQDIAEFFSFPILPCIAYSFFSLIYNVYFLITPTVIQNGELSIATVASTIAWVLISLYPLTLLLFNVTETVKEAKLTGRIIHKLLSTALKEEVKTELEGFSFQLLHENINFTAYGFFTLDFTLLHSMLGATATYLVILIQFQT